MPIGLVGIFSTFLVVNSTLRVRTLAELVTDGKANPKTLSFASGNTSSLIMGEMCSPRRRDRDLFIIRVAGNMVAPSPLGSVE